MQNTVQITIKTDGTAAITGINGVTTSLDSLTSHARELAVQAASAFGLYKVVDAAKELMKESALLAARVETLGKVLETVGTNTGRSKEEMHAYAEGVKAMGITTQESMQTIIRMSQANMDLAKAQDLARVAQDAAVIGNVNSSEALGHLIHGIQSAQVEVLRTIGINVNFEESYKRVAAETGRAVDSFTEAEKANIRLQAALQAGTNIAGTYEAAMSTTGKQITSLPRYIEEVKLKLGEMFTPALQAAVEQFTYEIKKLDETLQTMKRSGDMKTWGEDFAEAMRKIMAAAYQLGIYLDRIGQGMALVIAMFGFVDEARDIFDTLQSRAEASHRALQDMAMSASGFRRATEEDMAGGVEGMARMVTNTGEVLYYIKQAKAEIERPPAANGLATGANDAGAAAKKAADDLKKAQQALNDLDFAASLADPSLSDLDKAFMRLDRTGAQFKEHYEKFPGLFGQVDAAIAKAKGFAALDAQLKQAAEAAEKFRKAYVAREEFERELTDKSLSEVERRIAAEDKWLADMRVKALEFVKSVEEFDAVDVRLTQEAANAKSAIWNEYYANLLNKEADLIRKRQEIINSLVMDDVAQGTQGMTGQKDLQSLVAMGLGEDPYTKALAQLEEYYSERMQMVQDFAEFEMLVAQWEADEEAIIHAQKVQMASNTFGMLAGMTMSFYDATGRQSKAAFTAYKAFAIAQTTIDTLKAAMGAYSAMASIPIVGPALGVAAAAAAIAYGMARVSQIASMQPGGGASSITQPSTGGGQKSTASEASSSTQEEASRIPGITIHIYGNVYDQDKLARELVPSITKAIGDRVR